MKEGPLLVIVVKHPLAQVVGDVKGPVVVAAELVVDHHDGVVDGGQGVGTFSKQNVSTLQVIVAKYQRWVDSFNSFPGKNEKK